MASENEEKSQVLQAKKVPFEDALDKTGFGVYSVQLIALTGLVIIASSCILYGSTIIVPTSACELQTTIPQRGLLVAAPVIGGILGSVVWGYLGDTYGRRSMLLSSLTLGVLVYAAASISVNWIMLMVLQFVASMMAAGQYGLSMTMLSECVPRGRRNVALLLVASIFLLSQGLMAALAIPIIPLTFSHHLETLGINWNSWRTVVLIYCIPSIISLIWYSFVTESPKFVFVRGNEKDALKILKRIHRINHGKHAKYGVQGILQEVTCPEKSSAKDKLLPLFRKPLLKYTTVICSLYILQQVGVFVIWLPVISDQVARLLETGEGSNLTLCEIIHAGIRTPKTGSSAPCSLNVSALVFVLAIAGLQSVMNIVVSIFINRVGRRNSAMLITSICGVCGILINLVRNAIASVALFAAFLVGLLVLGLYAAIAVAVFPTYLRATAVSLALALGRLATFASVQILNAMLAEHCETGFYVFASLFTLSAVILSFLPDDRLLMSRQMQNEEEKSS